MTTEQTTKIRRRDRAYIVTVGTRLYLARGADPDHALDHLRIRYGYVLRPDEVVVREATRADLDLADLAGGGA
jgi:hypothetical protein